MTSAICAASTDTSDPLIVNLTSSLNPNSDVAAIIAAVVCAPFPGGAAFSTPEATGECGMDIAPSLSSLELSLDHSDRSPGITLETLEGMGAGALQTACQSFGNVSGTSKVNSYWRARSAFVYFGHARFCFCALF